MSAMVTVGFFGGAPGVGELLLIFVVLLLFFGAKNLPGIARTLGRTLEEFRKAARDVTDEIMHGDEETSDHSPEPEAQPDYDESTEPENEERDGSAG